MKPGDQVLVPLGNDMQEVGTVLKIGCTRKSDDSDEVHHDGILVSANVSLYKSIYSPQEVVPWKQGEEDAITARPRRLRASRSVVTPSPGPSSSTRRQTSEQEAVNDGKKPAAKRKCVSAESSQKKQKRKQVTEEVSTDSENASSPVASLPFHSASSLSASETASKATTASKKAAKGSKKKKNKAAIELIHCDDSSSNSSSDSDFQSNRNSNGYHEDNDDDDEDIDSLDRPYRAEYSPTGRATCRRCDQRIHKGALRISHAPLFRGKPGYRICRHLACAIFSEEILHISDVGGWQKLTKSDQVALGERIQESLAELDMEAQEVNPDELVQESFTGELRPSAPGLSASLLPFQVEGTSWMYCQEVKNPDIRGGILADEMGMGKTLQTIATVLDNRPILQHSKPGVKHPPSCPDLEARRNEEVLWKTALEEWKHEMDMNKVPPKLRPKKLAGARAGTLVVCPVVALSQWKTEIEKFTEAGTLSIGIYHGPNRASEMPATMIQKYDVVLTTYQVLEQDFRKCVSPNKVSCPNCGAKFKIEKLRFHLTYHCGDSARKTEAQARQRRTADRHNGSRGGGNGDKKRSGSSKKPPMTKVAKKAKTTQTKASKGKVTTKKTIRVRGGSDYDTDSELSIDEDYSETPGRGRGKRSAAVRVTTSLKDWKDDHDDESSFVSSSGLEESSSDDDLSDDTRAYQKLTPKKKAAKKKDQSGRDPDIERARQKQREALEAAKKTKKKTPKFGKDKKGKGKGKKRFDGNSSSSDDESDEEKPDPKPDPMAGIDMQGLMEEAMAGSRFSPLHSFCWWRIVLDEAHFIKTKSSQTAAAAFGLTAIHRWCLSGTPLQNRVGEFYSLIRFLRMDPMAHYFCKQKDCNCKSLHSRIVQGVCQDCGHTAFSHYAHFNKYVLNPITQEGYSGDGRRAVFKLKNEVLDKCLFRRTKETKAADLELPPRLVTLRSIRLHPVEEDFYNALYTQTKSNFDDYVAEGTLLNNYAHIFDLLTKMRQAVNHPYLIVYSKTNVERERARGQSKVPVANGSVDCDMCHEPPTDRVLSSCCGAGFCRSCVLDYLAGAGAGGGGEDDTPCPSCRAPFTIDLNQKGTQSSVDDGTLTVSQAAASSSGYIAPSLKELPHVATGSILRRIKLAEFATSTKIEALIQELIDMRKKRPGSKALVFSQFVNMLDLVRWRIHSDPFLSELKLGVKILHGGMDVKSRDAALKSFREDSGVRVLLMSLKSAGVALNLTAASEVILLDLWWNPAAEQQALDRVHRIGQHRPIRAVRFVAEGTVEERVLQLQEKKRLVFDGTVGRDAGSLTKLTANDMRALFT